MTDQTTITMLSAKLDAHVEDRIAERGSLGHLYRIENTDDGPVASMHGSAAASLWRVVREAITEAGWKIVRNGP